VRKEDKKPVLTSPWKIGMLVALLLVVVSSGAAYYLVYTYNIKLQWLGQGSGPWGIDSYLFFREIYPAAAGVVLLSLFAYFVVSSAVRRYKFYLDSGQDYRHMISLAESIDDLTSPSQIAKLRDYPELQTVLRNYGDQIREISEELNDKEEEYKSIDLEMEIDSLINGASVRTEVVEGKWWAPIIKKVDVYISERRKLINDLEQQGDIARRAIGAAALSHGKIQESIACVSEELLEIVKSVSDLVQLSGNAQGEQPAEQQAAPVQDAGINGKALGDMEASLQKLEDSARIMNEFSEENNGLALNMALMAAKGSVGEHDLAQLAEKVRSTAERFKKLADAVTVIGRDLYGKCSNLKSQIGAGGAGVVAVSTGGNEFTASVLMIAEKIDARSKSLQNKICALGSDLQDVHEAIQESMEKFKSPSEQDKSSAKDTGKKSFKNEIVNFGAGDHSGVGDVSDLVIDHGGMWTETESSRGRDFGSPEPVDTGGADEVPGDAGPELDDSPRELNLGNMFGDQPLTAESMDLSAGAAESPAASGDSTPAGLESAAPQEADARPGPGGPGSGESWMEMPGHRWVKVDVESTQQEDQEGRVDVEVTGVSPEQAPAASDIPPMEEPAAAQAPPAADASGPDVVPVREYEIPVPPEFEESSPPAAEIPDSGPQAGQQPQAQPAQQAPESAPAVDAEAEGETVYDLFELGAVEYVEETKVQ
jgi:hypothetical protein